MASRVSVPVTISVDESVLQKAGVKLEADGERLEGLHCFLQAEDGIRDYKVTGVQTCALPISLPDRDRADLRPLPPSRADQYRAAPAGRAGVGARTAHPRPRAPDRRRRGPRGGARRLPDRKSVV